MNKAGTKTFKIILFVGVFAYLQYHDVSRGAFSMNTVTGGLLAASAVYLLASLFGLVLNLSRNYLIAIVGTGALALFLAFKLDEVIAKVSWLTEERAAVVLTIFAVLCLVGDIFAIKKSMPAPNVEQDSRPTTEVTEDAPNIAMRNNMKSNPQSVLNLSNMLEKQWGRKPSYEEVMDYIDHLAIPEDNDF
jgi:phosphate/sulfate permease